MRGTLGAATLGALLLSACGSEVAEPTATQAATAEVPGSAIEAFTAEQTDAGVRLSWEPAGAVVDVFVVDAPDAELTAPAASGLTTGEYVVDATPEGPDARRYFALQSTSGAVARTALRVLPLEGGRNFRDLGGYETSDGQRVRWGAVFRSGTMSGFTADDQRYLDSLDVRTLVDFRSREEREQEPTVWDADDPTYWARDYSAEEQSSGLAEYFASGDFSAERTRERMIALYGEIADQQAEAYTELFDRLAAGELPLVFNCSAGKDRTGIAAALVLTALGVPRETIVADYAMSDDVADYAAAFEVDEGDDGEDSPYAFLRQLPRDAVMPLLASDPAYIEAALADLEARLGVAWTRIFVTASE